MDGELSRRRNLVADASLDSFLSVFQFSLAGNKSDLIVWIWIVYEEKTSWEFSSHIWYSSNRHEYMQHVLFNQAGKGLYYKHGIWFCSGDEG